MDPTADEMDYEVALSFLYTNTYGAEIYKDPLGRYTFKSVKYRTPFQETPMVNYQGDLYMGKDGAWYEVTWYLEQVDALGTLQTDRVPTSAKTVDSMQEQNGESNHSDEPGMHTSHLKQHLDKLFREWNVEREIKVTKVFQDDPI